MYYGIDGCKAGWIYVGLSKTGECVYGVSPSIEAFWTNHGQAAELVLIDIPIGLPFDTPRPTEQAAKLILKARRSSVFDVPMRLALEFGAQGKFTNESYQGACDINARHCGRRFSRQTWGIMPKIHEVDVFLRNNQAAQTKILEAHPEVLFWALSGRAMKYSKKNGLGFVERLEVLKLYQPDALDLIQAIYDAHQNKLVDDDIVDALAAAVSARLGNLIPLETPVPTDQHGLPMQMVYPHIRISE